MPPKKRCCRSNAQVFVVKGQRRPTLLPARGAGYEPHLRDESQYIDTNRENRVATRDQKKGGVNQFENHPTRQYPARTGPETSPIKLVDVVTPTDETGLNNVSNQKSTVRHLLMLRTSCLYI